jgi:two-component system, NarL family, sensor kinase
MPADEGPAPRRRAKRRPVEPRPLLPALAAPDRNTEALLRSTIDALSAHIAVLDRTGTIIAVNDAWRHFAETAGLADPEHGVGSNYLRVCEQAAAASPEAAITAKALRDILRGRRHQFRIEYPCAGPTETRWFQLRVTRPGDAPARLVVIAHEDITEAKRAQEELALLSARILQLQDEERRQIARELHDTTAQNLLAITLNLARLRTPLRETREPVPRILAETLALAEQSLQEIRTLSYLLHPPLLEEIGLASALRWYVDGFAERSRIKVELTISYSDDRLPHEVETALFRVHSGSGFARIALYRLADAVTLEVVDRGKGFSASKLQDRDGGVRSVGVGISGMRLRLRQLGGQLEIKSERSGTRVIATVPLPAAAHTVTAPIARPAPALRV